MSKLVKQNSRVSVVSRAITMVLGLLLSAALVGCVEPAVQNGVPEWNAAVPRNDPDDRPFTHEYAPPVAEETAAAATEPGKSSNSQLESEPSAASVEPARSLKSTVPDTVPDDSDEQSESPEPAFTVFAPTDPDERSNSSEAAVQDAVSTDSGEQSRSIKTTAQKIEPSAEPTATAVVTPVPSIIPAEPEKPVVDDDPDRLMGLGTGELTRMLGSPRFVRRDASAQLWRYRNTSCILDLFLYRGAALPEYFVSHIEARRSEGGTAQKRDCFGALLLDQLDRESG